MSRLTRDGTAEPVSRDQITRRERGQGDNYFPCSADHEQDWQTYPVDPYSAICDDHTYTIGESDEMPRKGFCLCSPCSHLNVLTIFLPVLRDAQKVRMRSILSLKMCLDFIQHRQIALSTTYT